MRPPFFFSIQERNRVGYVRSVGYRYPLLTPKTWPITGLDLSKQNSSAAQIRFGG